MNLRKLVDDCFDLAAVDFFTPGDDQVLDAVQDVEISVCVLIAHVARAKHSISKHRIGVLWIIPIPPHDIGAPSHQFTGLTNFNFLPGRVHDSQVDPGTGAAAGEQLVFCVLVVLQTGQKT